MSDPIEVVFESTDIPADVSPDHQVDLSTNPQGDDPLAELKEHRAKLEAQVDDGYQALVDAGVNPQEPPASMTVVGTLIEVLFGGEDDPQRITFDIRLAANRLRILEGVDPERVKAEVESARRFQNRAGRRGKRRR